MIIKSPSMAAEKYSILPCPYGCESSAGLALKIMLYNAIDVARIWTTDSAASENIAVECVKKYAVVLAANIPIPTNREIKAAFLLIS
jgi:hypothetical protein